MSTVIDVSGKLGEYMLKGWVLTDKICSNCSKVPLMRSPSGPTVYFCANCDAVPPTAAASSSRSGLDGSRRTPPTRAYSVQFDEKSSVSSASSMTPSRTSTPPTEVSQAPSSPTFAPPVDMGEVMRRRQQSDTASAEIGRRMLKGWAMLADECPNTDCYGIPLVRPPKAGGEKDPRKECVICGTVYVDEDGAFGSHLVPLQPSPPSNVGAERSTLLPPPPLAPAPQPIPAPRLEMPPSTSTVQLDKGKSTQRQATLAPPAPNPAIQPLPSVPSALGSYSAVQESIRSLEFALHALSERMKLLSNNAVLEPTLIAQTADAMAKVAQALVQVRRLE